MPLIAIYYYLLSCLLVAASSLQFDEIEKQRIYEAISFEEVQKEVAELKVVYLYIVYLFLISA